MYATSALKAVGVPVPEVFVVSEDVEKGKKRKACGDAQREDEQPLSVRHHVHYRIVVKEVCLPLKEFKSSSQLVGVVRDCIDGTFSPLRSQLWCMILIRSS